jgi:hypothetical protein
MAVAAPSGAGVAQDQSLGFEANTISSLPKEETERKVSSSPSLALDQVNITGALTEDEIKGWFKSNRSTLEGCVKGLNPLTVLFETVLKITVDSTGTVTGVTVEKANRFGRTKAECLAKAIQGLSMPTPSDGKGAVMTITLTAK